MIAIAMKAFFILGALSWYSVAIFSMINEYFRTEFNDYLKKNPIDSHKRIGIEHSTADTPATIDSAIIESLTTAPTASAIVDATTTSATIYGNDLASIYDNHNGNEMNSAFHKDNNKNNNVQSTGMVRVHCAQNECCYLRPIDFLLKSALNNICLANG